MNALLIGKGVETYRVLPRLLNSAGVRTINVDTLAEARAHPSGLQFDVVIVNFHSINEPPLGHTIKTFRNSFPDSLLLGGVRSLGPLLFEQYERAGCDGFINFIELQHKKAPTNAVNLIETLTSHDREAFRHHTVDFKVEIASIHGRMRGSDIAELITYLDERKHSLIIQKLNALQESYASGSDSLKSILMEDSYVKKRQAYYQIMASFGRMASEILSILAYLEGKDNTSAARALSFTRGTRLSEDLALWSDYSSNIPTSNP